MKNNQNVKELDQHNPNINKAGKKKNLLGSSLLFIIVCGTIGGLAGFFSSYGVEKIDSQKLMSMMEKTGPSIMNVLDWILVAIAVVFTVISSVIFFSQKKKAESLLKKDDYEDTEMEWITYRMNLPLILPALAYFSIIFALIYTCFIKYDGVEEFGGTAGKIEFAVKFVLFWIVLILNGYLINAAIKLVKKINPEKKGEVYSFTFGKDWMNSSDEGEKLIQYKAGYKTMKFFISAICVLWLLSIFYMIVFKSGLFTCFMLLVLLFVTLLVNGIEVMKLEKPVDDQ